MPINVKSYFRSSSGTVNLISIHPTFELISREPIDWQTVVAVPAAEPPACYWLTRHRFNTWSVGAVLPVSLFPDIHMCEMKLNLKRCWLSDTPEKKKKKKNLNQDTFFCSVKKIIELVRNSVFFLARLSWWRCGSDGMMSSCSHFNHRRPGVLTDYHCSAHIVNCGDDDDDGDGDDDAVCVRERLE